MTVLKRTNNNILEGTSLINDYTCTFSFDSHIEIIEPQKLLRTLAPANLPISKELLKAKASCRTFGHDELQEKFWDMFLISVKYLAILIYKNSPI